MANAVDQTGVGKTEPLPNDSIIILPVRQTVLFPGTVLPLAIGRPSSIAAAQEAVRSERALGVILQTDSAIDDPQPTQLHRGGDKRPSAALRHRRRWHASRDLSGPEAISRQGFRPWPSISCCPHR